jgi:hypothetical protein
MAVADNEILLTILLKHEQDKNLGEIGEGLDTADYAQKFPPEGIEVASWSSTQPMIACRFGRMKKAARNK